LDTGTFLDEFRPFRRGELALARRLARDPVFLSPRHGDLLRYALRLAQLSSIGPQRDALLYPIGSFRLRLLQLLAPVLPTDPDEMNASELFELLPRVVRLVDDARSWITDSGLASESKLDAEIAEKQLVLVMGGSGGSGYIYLGALQRLEELRVRPRYMVGCSMGSILAVVRARTRDFDLEEIYSELRRVRADGVFAAPDPTTRYGLPAALRLDLRRALGSLFAGADGEQQRLSELPIPVDVMATGLGPGALSGSRDEFARLVEVENVDDLSRLGTGAIVRLIARLVSLAMSRRVLVPVLFGADEETREIAALDAAGFSSAIPGLLHYDLPDDDARGRAVLDHLFERHQLMGLIDGGLATATPTSWAWEQIEQGRLGSRHCAIVVLDAVSKARGANAVVAPLLRTVNAASRRDRPYADLHVPFRRALPILELFPREARLRSTTWQGEGEFESSVPDLRSLLAPVPAWRELRGAVSGS